MIPRFRPMLGKDELLALLRRGRGAVRQFETEFARQFDAADAVAFPYGRSALWAFLKAVGLSGHDVIIPPYTCSVVAHAVSLSGNRPKFVDIRLADYNMDLDRLSDQIDARTRAIVATHIFGYPLDVDRVEKIVSDAEERYGHKIWLIQDCAHSFGADSNGRMVGASGDTALYGLNISKLMTSIFGGMLTFRDKELAAQIRRWRDRHFRRPGKLKPWLRRLYLLAVYFAFSRPIYGFTWWMQHRTPFLDRLAKDYHLDDKIHFPPDHLDRMLDVEACVGLAQLKKYEQLVALRIRNAAWYRANLPRSRHWELPPETAGATYSHYVLRTDRRDALADECARRGIELGRVIDYNLPDLESYNSEYACPNAREASRTVVNLPLTVGERELKTVLAAMRELA